MANEIIITRRITFNADFDVLLNNVPFSAVGKIVTFRLSVFKDNRFKDIFSVILDAVPNAFDTKFVTDAATWRLKIADEDTALIKQDSAVGTWWLTVDTNSDVDEIASGKFKAVNP